MFIGAVLETWVYQPKRSREAPSLGKGKWLGTDGPPPGVTTPENAKFCILVHTWLRKRAAAELQQ